MSSSCRLAPETVISCSLNSVMLSSFRAFQSGAIAAIKLRGFKNYNAKNKYLLFCMVYTYLYGSLALSVQTEDINMCTCEKAVKGGPRKVHSVYFHDINWIRSVRFVAIQHV
jgi:hypothetical protein